MFSPRRRGVDKAESRETMAPRKPPAHGLTPFDDAAGAQGLVALAARRARHGHGDATRLPCVRGWSRLLVARFVSRPQVALARSFDGSRDRGSLTARPCR